jgi:hypothetical protein
MGDRIDRIGLSECRITKSARVDFGIQYQIQTQFGVFTSLTQATYLDSFQFAEVPGDTELELRSGQLPGFLSDEAHLKWRANSRLDWAWHGFDLATTVHYLDGFHESINFNFGIPFNQGIFEHYVKQTWFFDVQASYNFVFVPAVETAAVPGYSKTQLRPAMANRPEKRRGANSKLRIALLEAAFEQHHGHDRLQ